MMKPLVLLLFIGYIAHAQGDSVALVLAPRIEKLTVNDWGFDDSTGEWSGARAFIPFDAKEATNPCSKCPNIPGGIVLYSRGSWVASETALTIEVYVNDMYDRHNQVFLFKQSDGYLSRVAWETLVQARWQASQRVWTRRAEEQAIRDNETRRLQQSVLRRFK